MSCFATADQPPNYVAFEGPWVVGVNPSNTATCTKLPFTLRQLQQDACNKQGLVFNGIKCEPAVKPWYQQTWFYSMVFILFALAALLLITQPTQTISAQQRFARFPTSG